MAYKLLWLLILTIIMALTITSDQSTAMLEDVVCISNVIQEKVYEKPVLFPSVMNRYYENLPQDITNKRYVLGAKGGPIEVKISFEFRPEACSLYGDNILQLFHGDEGRELLHLRGCPHSTCKGTAVLNSEEGWHEYSLRGTESEFTFYEDSYLVKRKYYLSRIIEYHLGA